MFNNNGTVLIKPLGLLVSGDQFGRNARLFLSRQNRFELVRDNLDGSSTVHVRAVTVYKASVTFTLSGTMLPTSALAFNEAEEARVEKSVEEEIENIKRSPEPEPVRKRGRPSRKAAAEEEESAPAFDEDEYFDRRVEELLVYSPRAYTLDIEEVSVANAEPLRLRNTPAYDSVAERSEANKTAVDQKLASVVSLVNQRAAKLNELNSFGDHPGQMDSLMTNNFAGDDLEDTQVGLLDQQALGGARQTIRNQLTAIENQLRSVYDWLDRNVIAKYNKTAEIEELPLVRMDFDNQASLDPSDVVKEMFTNVFVLVN